MRHFLHKCSCGYVLEQCKCFDCKRNTVVFPSACPTCSAEVEQTYTPVGSDAAARICEEFNKDATVIIAVDWKHDRTHTATFGKTPSDKLFAAGLGDYIAKIAGNYDHAKTYEDFRLVENAQLKARIDELEAEAALVSKLEKEITALRDELAAYECEDYSRQIAGEVKP